MTITTRQWGEHNGPMPESAMRMIRQYAAEIEALRATLATERAEGERLRESARHFVEMADVRVEGIGDMAYFDAYHDARMPLVVLLDELDAARPPSPTEEA